MMTDLDTYQWSPHATMDLSSRNKKAFKIERLLTLSSRQQPIELLEIGTGSGGIAHYFGTHTGLRCEVTAVDLIDQRQISEGYRFVSVTSTQLPFADACYDVVISNHVIEHVGDEHQQLDHLREIRRVLRPEGIAYLALPNRWMLVEPHYRLAFLSWLPDAWRTPYLRLMRRGNLYDCRPLTQAQIERAISRAGLDFEYLGTRAFREFVTIEHKEGWPTALLQILPNAILDKLAWINPTLIYRLMHTPKR